MLVILHLLVIFYAASPEAASPEAATKTKCELPSSVSLN